MFLWGIVGKMHQVDAIFVLDGKIRSATKRQKVIHFLINCCVSSSRSQKKSYIWPIWCLTRLLGLTNCHVSSLLKSANLSNFYRNCSLEQKIEIENFVAPPDAFRKVSQKLYVLILSKRDNMISTTFFKTLLERSLKISLLLFADLLKLTSNQSTARWILNLIEKYPHKVLHL